MTITLDINVRSDETDILHQIASELAGIKQELKMTEQQLSDKLDVLASDLTAKLGDISTEIASLKALGGATPTQLDSLGAKVDTMDAAIKGFATTTDTPPADTGGPPKS